MIDWKNWECFEQNLRILLLSKIMVLMQGVESCSMISILIKDGLGIGRLLYETRTHPDISHAVTIVS